LTRALGTNHIWDIPVPNPGEVNSAITYFMHVGDMSDARTRVITALLSQLLAEPAFNVLRTQETLGYIVSCGPMVLARDTHTGIKVFIQSERKPAYCEQRIEAFLAGQKDRLEGMPAEEFAEQKEGLKRKWLERLKNLREETNRFWRFVEAGHLDFHRRASHETTLHALLNILQE
jgi:insulysin